MARDATPDTTDTTGTTGTTRSFDPLSCFAGLLAVIASGLYLLDDSGAAQVDEAVTAATCVVGLGTAGLVRAVVSLRARG